MIQRYRKTIKLVRRFIPKGSAIYDMGHWSELGLKICGQGYDVTTNDLTKDLDTDQLDVMIKSSYVDVTTSFEVLEHLVNPYGVLKSVMTKNILITVPLKVWFSNAYWGKHENDRHYHEFEERQFFMLLKKSGWEVVESGKWYVQRGIGIRPFLRLFFPSYLWVYCEKR